MKYYENGKQIMVIDHNDLNISNPPDELLDELNIGYNLIAADKPVHSETQYLKDSYTVDDKNIIQSWEIIDYEVVQENEL